MPYANPEMQKEYNRTKWAMLSPEKQAAERARKAKHALSEKGKAARKAHYESKKSFYQAYERNRQYQKLYGITIDDYDRMLAEQNGGCKMCSAKTAGPKKQTFAVDHCHATGKVRGLLCVRCNVAVGFYEKHCDAIHKYLQDA